MEKFLCSFVQNDFVYSSKKLSANVDFNVESSIVKFLQKIIFKQDVLIEWKTILTLVSSPEEFTVENQIIKKTVKNLVDLLSDSDAEEKVKLDCFRCIFQAFVSSWKKEESSIAMQFFTFLCHILGMNELLTFDSNEIIEGIPIVNEKTFKTAFEADVSSYDLTSLSILKELLNLVSNHSINLDSPEMQPYFKWLQLLIRNLAESLKYPSISIEIFSECLDLGFKLVEINLDHIFLSSFQLQQECLDKNFLQSFYEFLEKILKTSAKYQRLVKYISRFLSLIKVTPKNVTLEEILPKNAVQEYSRILTIMSSQQLLPLMKVLVQQLEEHCNNISQNKNGASTIVFEVASSLLSSFLREVKIYAPSTSHATIQSFINELNHLKDILQEFGNFVLNEKKFISKNEKILTSYLELCFYCCEIQALVHCYKSTFSQSLLSATDDWESCFDLEQWDSLIENYFKEDLPKCHPFFFQMAFQKIRISKLRSINLRPSSSTMRIIIALFESDPYEINLFHHLAGEDLILLMEVLTKKQRKLMAKKFLDRILIYENEMEVSNWMSNAFLLESQSIIINLFAGMIEKISLIVKKILSTSQKETGEIFGLMDDFFEESNNELVLEKMKKLPERMNSLLEKSLEISKILETGENSISLRRISHLFNCLPLIHMETNLKSLGLAFAVELAILCSRHESLVRIPLEKLYEFLGGIGIDLKNCFDVGIFLKWLIAIESNEFKKKIIERLIVNYSTDRFILGQIENLIESRRKDGPSVESLETEVAIYEELGQCLSGEKKRKAENGPIENCRAKLAKVISEEFMEIGEGISLNDENYKLLFKMLRIKLQKSGKKEVSRSLSKEKFSDYFEFAVNKLENEGDEACCLLLLAMLERMSKIRELTPEDAVYRIWTVLKRYPMGDWKIFAQTSSNSEFERILNDLLDTSKEFLNVASSLDEPANYFDIWQSFLELDWAERRNKCQIRLQHFFHYIRDFETLLPDVPTKKKIRLTKFFCYCLSNKELVLTPQMLDTVMDALLHCPDDSRLTNEEFHDLFTNQVEAATSLFVRHFVWNKSKIHLSFCLFDRLISDLARRSDSSSVKLTGEDVFFLSACAFSVEKWINLMSKMKKDLARITPYFITAIITCITTVTVLPAIKIHLVNCLNSFLSMSDSYTTSYLLRVLKPGHQQVFTSLYDQFKKFHKYSGKI